MSHVSAERAELEALGRELDLTRASQQFLSAKLDGIQHGRVYRVVRWLGGWKWLRLDDLELGMNSGSLPGSARLQSLFEQCTQLSRRVAALEFERAALLAERDQLQTAVSELAQPGERSTEEPARLQDAFELTYSRLREPKVCGMPIYEAGAEERLMAAFRSLGIAVSDYVVDAQGYNEYFSAAGYVEKYPAYYSFNLPEKSLEHYIAATLLQLSSSDTYIDIASEHSPVPEIYGRLFGATTFRQDLAYELGLNGDRIGGDAAAMPVPDGFASKLALHCSFEHFEGDADSRFMREIERVLKPGGTACFVPFYVAEQFANLTDPEVSGGADVPFDADAIIHGAQGWGNRFGRFYDPQHVYSRLCRHLGRLRPTVYRIVGTDQVDPSCYARFALVITAPAAP